MIQLIMKRIILVLQLVVERLQLGEAIAPLRNGVLVLLLNLLSQGRFTNLVVHVVQMLVLIANIRNQIVQLQLRRNESHNVISAMKKTVADIRGHCGIVTQRLLIIAERRHYLSNRLL